jgi:predicted nucleic acid-binding protein
MVIADTGVWLALANRNDRFHHAAVEAVSGMQEELITTWPVVTETCHLLSTRLGAIALEQFLGALQGGAAHIFSLQADHLPRILQLVRKYRQLPMDLADASLVLLAEELGSGRILSTDRRDFRAYRWKNRKPFKNLLDVP